LGPVGSAAAAAFFFNFHPGMVARSLPDAWALVPPVDVLEMRRTAAAKALKLRLPSAEDLAATVGPILHRAVAEADGSGRALFSANQRLDLPADPVEALWQSCTSLREHRGDGHVAMLTSSGLDGCEALALFAASEGIDPEVLRQNRGWSESDWASASDRLRARGLLGDRGITPAGSELRRTVEDGTDRLASRPYQVLDPDDVRLLTGHLGSAAEVLMASGVIPFPNPIGLPPPTTATRPSG
ncbi:MAG: SCO6745 family protein, partial [Acidimicrobiales bacterium]